MKIYTKTGDRGKTGLFGGGRVRKDHPRVEAYGDVDELNAFLGQARADLPRSPGFNILRADLRAIQKDLFSVGAVLAAGKSAARTTLSARRTAWLETRIDKLDAVLPRLKNFILPGGSHVGAGLHICRTVCRRAERGTARLGPAAPPRIVAYLNRLSDYLFVAARWVNKKSRKNETEWKGTT